MMDGLSQEMKDALAANDAYEARKGDHDAKKQASQANIQQLDDVRAQLVLNEEAADAEAEAELAPLRTKRDEAQARADAKHNES